MGFSRLAVDCYKTLREQGGCSVSQLAGELGVKNTGLYRCLHYLEARGFVVGLKTSRTITYYYAEPPRTALKAYFTFIARLAKQKA